MIGTVIEVFEITGRGCVVLIDVESGNCRTGDHLVLDNKSFPIDGIEMQNWGPEAIRRLQAGWSPPLGLLLGGAKKADLLKLVGEKCFSQEGARPSG